MKQDKPTTPQQDSVRTPNPILVGVLLCLPLSLWADEQTLFNKPTQETSYQHAARCVAVLKHETLPLVERHKSAPGQNQLLPRIEQLTEWGFAIIGTAYKQGLRKAQADPMLDAADAALAKETPERLKQEAEACQAEGAQLLRQANALERMLVANRAKARVKKLLNKDT